jgi:phosphomannomutase
VDLDLRPGQNQLAITYFAGSKLTRILDWPVTRREDLDGVKVYLGEIGWVMVRASGTEPILRVYAETSSAAATRAILEETCTIVRAL